MRTGAIFARGSCKALMWVLALGTAVMLSAGDALAQATATGITVSESSLTVSPTEPKSFTVGLNGTLGEGAAITVTVRTTIDGTRDGADFRVDSNALPDEAGAVTGFTELVFSGPTDDNDAETFLTSTVTPRTVVLSVMPDNDATDGENALTFETTSTHDHDGDGAGTSDPTADPPTTGPVSISAMTLSISEDDPDALGVTVSPTSLNVNEGSSETYTLKLGSEPSASVMIKATVKSPVNANITLMGADSDGTKTFTFTSGETGNWSSPQTVTVMAGSDSNIINGSASIEHSIQSEDLAYNRETVSKVSVKEIDNVRTITLSTSPSGPVAEGKAVTITAALGNNTSDDTPVTLSEDVVVTFSKKPKVSTAEDGDFTVGKLTIGKNSTSGSVKVMAEHDQDEDDEVLILVADASGPATFDHDENQEIRVEIMDDDTYTLEPNKTEANEGDEVMLTVKVDPAAALETKVMIELYRASGATVEAAEGQDADPADNKIAIIDKGEKSARFTLKTLADGDSDDEMIEVQAKVGKAVVGSRVTINVIDGQDYMLSLEPNSIGEADGEASVMVKVETNKVISATKDTMLTLAVDAASTATAMEDYSIMPAEMMVTIAKGEKMGMTELMVTPVADGMDEANETIVLTAWKGDAQVGNAAELMIIDGDSTTFTLSGPSDMNLVEGFEYDIEVMASTPVRANTTVMIMHGEGSTATADDDYMIEDIMIMAGETMGRTKLMVKSDDMPDGGTDGGMAEKLVLYGMVGNMRTNDVSFYIWDLAVPALPVIAQLLLATLMAVGGYRRYRRR